MNAQVKNVSSVTGSERPDVRQVGILSFATIVYNSYSQGKLSVHKFEKYVKKYFDLFLGEFSNKISNSSQSIL